MIQITNRRAALYEFWDHEVASRMRGIVQRLRLEPDEKTDLIEDIRHHTVEKLLEREPQIENLRAFATQTGLNFFRDRLVRWARRPEGRGGPAREAELIEGQPADEQDWPERRAAESEVAKARREMYEVIKCIRFEVLCAEWDAAFVLVYDLHLSMRQAAKTLGLPFATVQYRMKSALEEIRDKLAELVESDVVIRDKVALAFGEERLHSLLRTNATAEKDL